MASQRVDARLPEPTDNEDIAMVANETVKETLLEPTDEDFEDDDEETVELDAVGFARRCRNRRSC
ncbi:MAG: hypothetical protein ACLUR5_16170 [Eubacterium ventriosum]